MDPAEQMDRLPLAEVFKLQHIGGDLVVDKVRGNRLLIRPIVPKTELDRIEKETNLVLPQGLKEKYTPMSGTGIIVRVGDGVEPGTYEEGQGVFYSKWSGTDFTESKAEGTFKIIPADDVLCTMRAKDGKLSDAIRVANKQEAA